MATHHEKAAEIKAEKWLASLPSKIKANTLCTQTLREHWATKNPSQIAISFVDCVEQKVWEQIAYLPSVESKREVRSYTAIEWIRECIGAEPDQLMRTVAGYLPNANEANKAAISLIELMLAEEPKTLNELSDDYLHGDSHMPGWEKLFGRLQEVDPAWSQAKTCLKQAVQRVHEGPRSNHNRTQNQSASNLEELNTYPFHRTNRIPKDSKSRLIRRLIQLKEKPDQCKAKGTTPEKVTKTLNRLVRGLLPSVEAAKREAGLIPSNKPSAGLGIRGPSKDVARRIIKTVGKEPAHQIARAIFEALKT